LIRAVLDVNVLVSAFISQRGAAPDRIMRAWREGAFELVVSPKLIAELVDVLGRPKFKDQAGDGRAQAFVAALAGDALRIEGPPDPPSLLADPDDDYLPALAKVAKADAIVSGDNHLREMDSPTVSALTPREFFALLA
jgi:uncharacterized protein